MSSFKKYVPLSIKRKLEIIYLVENLPPNKRVRDTTEYFKYDIKKQGGFIKEPLCHWW